MFDVDEVLIKLEQLYPALEIEETETAYIMPTICHNEEQVDGKKKLYLYKNSGLFHCYTECGCTFNIWQLIKKRSILEGRNIQIGAATNVIRKDSSNMEEILTKLRNKVSPLSIKLDSYDGNVLSAFQEPNSLHPWALEGIDISALQKFNIKFSKSYNWVIIPHYDWRGRLIGIRRRTYNQHELASMKYGPLFMNNMFFTHKLSLNLYGLNQNLNNIKKYQTIVIAESEKSVLQAETMFADNLTVALGGSSIHSFQMDLIIKLAQPKLAVVALDKEYNTIEEMSEYFMRLSHKFKHLTRYMEVVILLDVDNIFKLKESPFDRTVNDFEKLHKWKVGSYDFKY